MDQLNPGAHAKYNLYFGSDSFCDISTAANFISLGITSYFQSIQTSQINESNFTVNLIVLTQPALTQRCMIIQCLSDVCQLSVSMQWTSHVNPVPDYNSTPVPDYNSNQGVNVKAVTGGTVGGVSIVGILIALIRYYLKTRQSGTTAASRPNNPLSSASNANAPSISVAQSTLVGREWQAQRDLQLKQHQLQGLNFAHAQPHLDNASSMYQGSLPAVHVQNPADMDYTQYQPIGHFDVLQNQASNSLVPAVGPVTDAPPPYSGI